MTHKTTPKTVKPDHKEKAYKKKQFDNDILPYGFVKKGNPKKSK
jgi:hypothetical protein